MIMFRRFVHRPERPQSIIRRESKGEAPARLHRTMKAGGKDLIHVCSVALKVQGGKSPARLTASPTMSFWRAVGWVQSPARLIQYQSAPSG